MEIQEIARQGFFFLKDVFHRHKHHDVDEERWVDIVPSCKWKDEILANFIRKYISMMPSSEPRMAGIAGYINTLATILGEEMWKTSRNPNLACRLARIDGLADNADNYGRNVSHQHFMFGQKLILYTGIVWIYLEALLGPSWRELLETYAENPFSISRIVVMISAWWFAFGWARGWANWRWSAWKVRLIKRVSDWARKRSDRGIRDAVKRWILAWFLSLGIILVALAYELGLAGIKMFKG